MHNVITEFFTNSLSFGFTGTPIFAKNSDGTRTTKDIFGKKLHEYVIKDESWEYTCICCGEKTIIQIDLQYKCNTKKNDT